MKLSSISIEQREKEAEALKIFLLFSFIASLALHIGVLALAINRFLLRLPEVTEEPIEVTILENIPQEVAQPPVEIKSLPKINSGGGGGNQGGEIAIVPIVKQHLSNTTNKLITKQSPKFTTSKVATIPTSVKNNLIQNTTSEPITTPTPVKNNPVQKLNENADTLASTPPLPNTKSADIPPLKSESHTNSPSNSTPATDSSQNLTSQHGNILGNLGNRLRNSFSKSPGSGIGVGNGSGIGIGNGSGIGIGNGSGIGVGNASGTGIGNETKNKPKQENIPDKPLVTAPKTPRENSSKLNRADCLQCQIKYPDRARRRGAEGNPEVAIDTDAQGNVTRVRLIRSSGDTELDEAAQKAAQEWKLTPTETGRDGVRASVNFAIKGSQRHRQIQEHQIEKQRAATQKKPEKEASTPIESLQRNQRKTNPIVTDIPPENTTKRKQESVPTESKPVSPPRQRIEPEKPKQTEESKPRYRSPQPVKSDPSNQVDEGRAERVQKSRRRLEEILRRRQKSSDSPPPEPATKTPTESNGDVEP